MKKYSTLYKTILLISIISFATHFIWENLHIPLYIEDLGFDTKFGLSLWATSGDVAYTFIIFLVFAGIKRNIYWIKNISKKDLIFLAIAGLILASVIEYKAMILDKWSYGPYMPIIPILNIGLSPVLQMMILLPLTMFVSSKVVYRLNGGN